MFKVTNILLLTFLLSTMEIANADSTTRVEDNQIVSSREFINKDDYLNKVSFEGIKMNTLFDNRISFNYCFYKRKNTDLEEDCSLALGDPEGYSQEEVQDKFLNYEEKRNTELLTSGALAAAIIVVGAIRLHLVRYNHIVQYSKGEVPFSQLQPVGSKFMYDVSLAEIKSRHIKTYAGITGGLVAGKMWLIDDAGDYEDMMVRANERYEANARIVNSRAKLIVEDLDPKEIANRLSRALQQ